MKYFLLFLIPFGLFAKSIHSMTLEEKVGQLFMVPAHPNHLDSLEKLLFTFPIDAVVTKATDLKAHRQMMERLPFVFFMGMDAEWGLGMRMKDAISFPKNLTLGAIQDLELIYELGKAVGEECRKIGGHINFAPVIDVNSNPENPIIHMRSFGDDPIRVAEHAKAWIEGMNETGMISCVKHFPGHGDAFQDSHKILPLIDHTFEEHQLDLKPFMELLPSVGAVMTAHLLVPALDPENPTTFSSKAIYDVLRKTYQFPGLIISDALCMKALTDTPEEIAIKAFRAGHDILLYGDHIAPIIERILIEDVPRAFQALVSAFQEGRLDISALNERVERILRVKEKIGPGKVLKERDLEELKRRLYQSALTLVQNASFFPVKESFVLIEMNQFGWFSKGNLEEETYVVLVKDIQKSKPHFGVDWDQIKKWDQEKNVVLVLLGTPYVLYELEEFTGAILMAYEQDRMLDDLVIEAVTGKFLCKGKLPIKKRPADSPAH